MQCHALSLRSLLDTLSFADGGRQSPISGTRCRCLAAIVPHSGWTRKISTSSNLMYNMRPRWSRCDTAWGAAATLRGRVGLSAFRNLHLLQLSCRADCAALNGSCIRGNAGVQHSLLCAAMSRHSRRRESTPGRDARIGCMQTSFELDKVQGSHPS